jgi:hypothetical protein
MTTNAAQLNILTCNDQIDITHYDLNLNLGDYKKAIVLLARVKAATRASNLRAVSFEIGENLGEYESWRLKKQMRLKQARLGSDELAFAQEDWEAVFTGFSCDCHYPRSNEHGFLATATLDRATFDHHLSAPKKFHMASGGLRLSEEPDPEDKNLTMTKYQLLNPCPH